MTLLRLLLALCLCCGAASAQDFWRQAAGPYGGTVRCLAGDGADVFFAGTDAGLYRSADRTETWRKVRDTGFDDQPVHAVLTLPGGGVAVGVERGVFLSVNGTTWADRTANMNATPVRRLAFFADTLWAGSAQLGLYASADEGQSWSRFPALKNLKAVADLQADAGRLLLVSPDTAGLLTYAAGVWAFHNNGLPADVKPSCVLAAMGRCFLGAADGSLYRADKNLALWEKLPFDADALTTLTAAAGRLYAATEDGLIYASPDTGRTWQAEFARATPAPIHQLRTFGADVMAGVALDGVLLRSGFGAWTARVRGLTAQTVVSAIWADERTAYSCIPGRGVDYTTSSGDSWKTANSGLGSFQVQTTFALQRNILLTGTVGAARIYRSTNSGLSWEPAGGGVHTFGVACFTVDSNRAVFAGGTTEGVFRSGDNGVSWKQMSLVGLTLPNIAALAVTGRDTLWAGTSGAGVFRFVADSVGWVAENDGLISRQIFALHRTRAGVFYAAASDGVYAYAQQVWAKVWTPPAGVSPSCLVSDTVGQLFVGTRGAGVYASVDSGRTWQTHNEGLFGLRVRALSINSNSELMAATEGDGVFVSTTTVNARPRSAPSIAATLYPNPARDVVTIAWRAAGRLRLEVRDVLGRVVLRQDLEGGSSSVTFDVGAWPAGVYACRLAAADGAVWVQKVVVGR